MSKLEIFSQELNILNIGSPAFIDDLVSQNVRCSHIDWKPPAGGNRELISILAKLEGQADKIRVANDQAIRNIQSSQAILTKIAAARDVVPGMHSHLILHAGPPIAWENMAGPMQGAILGAIVYEGIARNLDEAEKLVKAGEIEFGSAHEHDAVGPMAGVLSASMPVHVIHDPVHNNSAFCTINEGLGKVLRYGANSDAVLAKLKWIQNEFAPLMNEAIQLSGGIDVKNIAAQALQMGDECHNRNKASTSLFFREITEWVLRTAKDEDTKIEVLKFIRNNEHYFLNLSMPMAKVGLMSAQGIAGSSIVTTMARNGNQFGIKIASSDTWFQAPANFVKGLMFPGFTEDDAAPDIGDSAITETFGIGGFAMGGAPAIVGFVGGTVEDAFNYSRQMNLICHGKNPGFALPTLDFEPTAQGIDIIKVVESTILPIINTGMAHKKAGVGQVGAGLVHPPMACFESALREFASSMG